MQPPRAEWIGDPVEAAAFPQTTLRFRNDDAAWRIVAVTFGLAALLCATAIGHRVDLNGFGLAAEHHAKRGTTGGGNLADFRTDDACQRAARRA